MKSRSGKEPLRSPEHSWVIGRGWDQDRFRDKRYPTRKDLDEVSEGRPVYIVRACGHIAVASSKALEMAGIKPEHTRSSRGAIDKDAYGDPTGVLRETAQGLVKSHIPDAGPDIMEDALKKAIEHVFSKGITSVHTNDGQAGFPGTMELYKKVQHQGFPLRFTGMFPGISLQM